MTEAAYARKPGNVYRLAMQTWDAIRARRNVRSYTTDPVPAADLDRIAEAAWRAPSSSVLQTRTR